MKRALRLICILLCLTFLPLPVWAEDTELPAPTIRVMLRRLELTDRADLILDGVYTAAMGDEPSMAFPKGSEVTVQIRSGELYLFYQGVSLFVGEEIRFIRNASQTQQYEGIRFEEGGNFYPGDLHLTIKDGMLLPVLTISVEHYLMGVVPYEMSDHFPLEALKAQAVCARTYALSHVDTSAAYDVVDTANDQVFRGVNLRYSKAIQAVEETAGVVGTYKGKLASCYYSASNGGQTELVQHVWSGRGDWGYYAMVDDPYDLENPDSLVRKARLNKNGDNLPEEFVAVVSRYMEEEMTARGFEPVAEAFRIDSITGLSLGAPKFAEPSRLLTEMTITFHWSGRELLSMIENTMPAAEPDEELLLFATPSPSPEAADAVFVTAAPSPTPQMTEVYSEFIPVEEPATLALPIFPEVLRALNLSINGTDNELLTLVESDTTYTIEARRYGHGVGMSQRGAQQMAGYYDMTYDQILDFYYPGMTLSRIQAGEPNLPTAQPELAQSPAPPATPTPRPTLMPVSGTLPKGAYLASVEGIEDDSSLNLRVEPSTSSAIIMRLYKHQQLVVLETCEDPAWVKVKTNVVEGYVMVSFLEKVE